MANIDSSIRNDLSNVTFEELLKIRDKLGTKVYRHTVLNQLNDHDDNQDDDQDGQDGSAESDLDSEDEIPPSPKKNIPLKKKVENKRQDRSEPIETSSKKLDPRFNFLRVQPSDDLNRKRKAKTFRDPRFDQKCGQFRADKFEQNYAFLTNVKRTELETLKKKLKKAKNEETKEKIRFLIQRLSNQIKADEEREQQKQLQRQIRMKNSKQFQITKMDDNTKPDEETKSTKQKSNQPKMFINKSLLKRTALVEKYKQLKQTGKLDKYLERKRKKLATKDRKKLFQDQGHKKHR